MEKLKLSELEKQVILFTKGHYETTNIDFLKYVISDYFWGSPEDVTNYNCLLILSKIYDKLVTNGVLKMDLYSLILSAEKRHPMRSDINLVCIIKELFAQIQGIEVVSDDFEFDLGEIDLDIYNNIQKKLHANAAG